MRHALALALISSLPIACARETPAPPQNTVTADTAAPAGSSRADTTALATPPPLGVHKAGELERAAADVVAFLRGDVTFERVQLADTVRLYVSPEGGGDYRDVPRALLRDPAMWKVRTSSGTEYSFLPSAAQTELTTRAGRHFNCQEQPLSSRFPELARLPHVGTLLMPRDSASCLQSWNLTLVFAAERRPPTLVAAVYDQWEW